MTNIGELKKKFFFGKNSVLGIIKKKFYDKKKF